MEKIIPKNDREHRDGFDNSETIASLSPEERQTIGTLLLAKLAEFSQGEVDTLVVDTIAQLKLQSAVPTLRRLLSEDAWPLVKLSIATAIHQIADDNQMINIAIDIVRSIDNHKGPYRATNLSTAFSYLSKFDEQPTKDMLSSFAKSDEYLVAYNAGRFLQYQENC